MSEPNGPVEINAANFFDFIAAPGPAVMFVSVHPVHPVNRALGRRLREVQGTKVPFGAVALVELMLTASPALAFLRRGLASCGVSMTFEVLPGYYLFHHGRMLAWDSGLPNRNDVVPIAKGSILGMIAFAFSRDVGLLGRSLRLAMDEATAVRLLDHFRRVVEEDRRNGHPSAPPPSEDDFARACRTLGISPDATDHDVERAWRKLRIEFHPDRATADPVEYERRSRLATEINWARDVIRNHRTRTA